MVNPLTLNSGSGAITFAGNQTLGSNENFSATTTSGNINTSNSGIITTAGSGTITMNSGGDINLNNFGLTTANSAVSLTATGNAYLNAINSGTGSLTVNATNVYLYGGGLPSPGNEVGYYNFNEGSGTTAIDDSGSGNTGTLTSGPTYSSSVPGALSNDPYSLVFNGSNYVNLGTSDAMSGSFSLSVWAYRPATLPTEAGIISRRNGGNINYQIAWDTGGGLAFYVGGVSVADNNTIASGWHLVTAVYNSSNTTSTLYLDGAVVGSNFFGRGTKYYRNTILGYRRKANVFRFGME